MLKRIIGKLRRNSVKRTIRIARMKDEQPDFSNTDLSGLDLSNMDLRGVNFRDTNLSFTNLSNSDLSPYHG